MSQAARIVETSRQSNGDCGVAHKAGAASIGFCSFLLLCIALLSSASGQWVEKTIYLPDSLSRVSYPCCIAYNSVDDKIYVAGDYGNGVRRPDHEYWMIVIDGKTDQKTASIRIPDEVWQKGLGYNPVNNKVR